MSKNLFRVVSIICIFALLCASALAATNASYQIASYETNASHAGGGRISILVSVFAKDYMDVLGASSVFVYEKVGSAWVHYKTFNMNDNGMTTSDSTIHDDYVYCNAYTGGEFRVDIVIFAKDYSGSSDSRSETHYVTT